MATAIANKNVLEFKIRLRKKGVEPASERETSAPRRRATEREERPEPESPPEPFGTSLADKLRAALDRQK